MKSNEMGWESTIDFVYWKQTSCLTMSEATAKRQKESWKDSTRCGARVRERCGFSRASFAFYNTKDEIDVFIKALHKVIKMFS